MSIKKVLTKKFFIVTALFGMIILAACAGIQLPGQAKPVSAQSNTGQNGGGNNPFNPANMTLESKLAVGTLKLEGTPNAVTQKEAATLLPLWQAFKSLVADNNTTPDEINALYKQIEDAMTPDQITAIKAMTLQQSDFQALAQQYGVQFGGGNFGANGANGTLTPSQRSTRVAQFAGRTGGGGNGGFFGGGGGGTGNFGANGGNGAQPSVTRTPRPGASARRAAGLNNIFINPLIKVLQQRAGS